MISLPSRCEWNRVLRMPDESPAEIEESLPPKRGWKPGNTHSARTRAKISHTRAEQERKKREAKKNQLPTTWPTLSDKMRDAIVERDGLFCRSCGDAGPKLMVTSFIEGLDDLNALERQPELHAVMCSFCRDVAKQMQARDIGAMLRTRW